MKLRNKIKLSIQNRLRLATMLSVVSFVVIALILLMNFIHARANLVEVVDSQLRQTVDNAHLAREMGDFLGRLKLLEATFYGNDEYLQQEGKTLLQALKQHQYVPQGGSISQLHLPLEKELIAYLDQCKTINELLLWRQWEEEGLNETIVILEEILAERMIEATVNGEPVAYYEQLTLAIAGYQVDLLEIFLQNARADKQALFDASFSDPPPNTTEFNSLVMQLQPLAAAEPPLNRFGRYLTDQLTYYQHLMARYQQEMIHLGRQTVVLNQILQQIPEQMALIDQQHAAGAERARQEIDRAILTKGGVFLVLLVVLALLLGLIHRNLFYKHIKQPMDNLHSRLLKFQQGDYRSPMSLNRSDEWSRIEEVFDAMLGDLVKSWSALEESEGRYRNLFESASEAIFQSTVEGVSLDANPAMYRMFGIPAGEGLTSINDLRKQLYANAEDRDRLIDRLLQEETVNNYETEMRRLSGATFWASINCHLVRDKDGQVKFIEGTIEDISLRRQAEEELRKLKEYLHDIVDTMPSILIGVNDELKVTLWNRQAEEISGMAADHALGQSLPAVFLPIDPSVYLGDLTETLQSGEVSRLQKISGSGQDQGRFFDLLIYPLRAADAGGAVIHIDDVTEKVQIVDVMVQSEKMLSVGNLAAGMAHEINNPLAAVLQNVQVMSQRLSPALEKNRKVAEQLGITMEQVAEYAHLRGLEKMMQSITTAGQRAARIIENMLNFSRKSSSSFLPCSLTDLLEKTIELAASDYDMKHHFDFRTIDVIREYQPSPDVPCEPSQIQQVILNLLKNAAQAIGNETTKPEIRVRVFPLDDQVCVQIADNGSGMDEATCKRAFEPFYTTKAVGVGTGLGLSVSYFLITENHKGSLTVTSELGQGSCFSILLPCKR